MNASRSYAPLPDSRDRLTTGEELYDRRLIQATSLVATSGSLRLSYFTCRKSESTSQVRVMTGGTAAAATPTLCRLGLYSVDSNGDGTLVASTTNDTTLFAATNTAYTKAWTTPYSKVAGQRYALGVLVVSGAATPTFHGLNAGTGTTPMLAEMGMAPRLAASLGSQTDLPASFTNAGLSTTAQEIYAAILP